jgi:hypothetical protein
MRQAARQVVPARRFTPSMRCLGSAPIRGRRWLNSGGPSGDGLRLVFQAHERDSCNISLRSIHISNVIRYFIVLEAPGHCPDRESLKTFA